MAYIGVYLIHPSGLGAGREGGYVSKGTNQHSVTVCSVVQGSPTHGTDPPPLKSSLIPLWPAEDPEPDEGDVAALLQFAKSLNVSEIERYD